MVTQPYTQQRGRGRFPVAKRLLEAGADVNLGGGPTPSSYPPLRAAAEGAHIDMVKDL